ncbi:hypothetical protein MRS44_012390 [Fusarium solani]|uniref:uncharacterized protein n=1 Tax=Fusarium solani TaxID=169388 RepID=UPI0032C4A69B|nr:hypothetical protein MRS44_012390 [Fusarium solani]
MNNASLSIRLAVGSTPSRSKHPRFGKWSVVLPRLHHRVGRRPAYLIATAQLGLAPLRPRYVTIPRSSEAPNAAAFLINGTAAYSSAWLSSAQLSSARTAFAFFD